MARDFDKLLQRNQKKLIKLKPQADKIRQSLIIYCAKFISRWYAEKMKEYVTNNTAQTNLLGEVRLRRMKEKVSQLIKDADKIAREILSDRRIWWPFDETVESLQQQQYLSVEDAIRFALGKIFPILKEFGYVPGHEEIRRWSKIDSYGEGVRYQYPYKLHFPRKIKSILNRYKRLFMLATRISVMVCNLVKQKKTQEAQRLWDSA